MTPTCLCGCGEPIVRKRNNYTAKYVSGHQLKRPDIAANRHAGQIKRRIPPNDLARHTGICLCGCGQATELATYTNRSRDFFIGTPLPYVAGHKPRKSSVSNFTGRRRTEAGYIYVYNPEHPNALTKKSMRGYVAEHRVVLEGVLGRMLLKNEHGHHINGIRDDNRPENLVALTRSAHRSLHAKGHTCSEETRARLSDAVKRSWVKRKAHKS